MRLAKQVAWMFCMIGAFHLHGRWHEYPTAVLVGFSSALIFAKEHL